MTNRPAAIAAAILPAITLAACATAHEPVQLAAIPGVDDRETVITSGIVEEYHRGAGDSLYVRDRENKWYRVGLNEGCLKGGFVGNRIVFERDPGVGRIDTFSRVILTESGRSCNVTSIRRSVAPPQVDSSSPLPV
ncbi:hypothetical protein [Paraurantiacibacter namhicola]|uniref:Bacterial SH3 domain protein n=1 Tax=Paraurantiacibacter namhicola TaxID=645517 RepID=A0A1C7DAR4_9SPHN|nr:hypothetical protein [Paraurantiacibacter namhicola]ANU08472.1 hypothetical protein A6F65_02187 [Paraurantiacibacter namhicola]